MSGVGLLESDDLVKDDASSHHKLPSAATTPLPAEIEKLKQLIDTTPAPHEGRIQELKDSIRAGTLLTPEVIYDTASALTKQLLGWKRSE